MTCEELLAIVRTYFRLQHGACRERLGQTQRERESERERGRERERVGTYYAGNQRSELAVVSCLGT